MLSRAFPVCRLPRRLLSGRGRTSQGRRDSGGALPQVPQRVRQDERAFAGLAADARKGGLHGPAIVPGKPDESLLVRMISGRQAEDADAGRPAFRAPRSPRSGSGSPTGAPWPEDLRAGRRQGRHCGRCSRSRSRRFPQSESQWARTPIDAFVLAKLDAMKLTPSAEADAATLIRRLTYDLHGLPPAWEEIQAFVADRSPDAYEKLVDRLLASPRYGERWGRHWLDVVHYGESHGYDKDKPRRNAWPYRDYVIRAFNEDKPYARFVEEQLAGDVLWPGRSARRRRHRLHRRRPVGLRRPRRSCARAPPTRTSRACSTATTW